VRARVRLGFIKREKKGIEITNLTLAFSTQKFDPTQRSSHVRKISPLHEMEKAKNPYREG
jgi:phage/plasmid-associated DNA primase